MNTHLQFRSDAFPAYPGEEDEINPGIWGKRLAEYLAAALPGHELSPGEINSEDWGWIIPIQNESFPLFIGCSNQVDPGGNEFLCFIEPSRPEIRKGFFKKVSTVAEVMKVSAAMESILGAHPEISGLSWGDDTDR
jgi:hypothetical protein